MPDIPSVVKVEQTSKYQEKEDPPLVDLKVTNPIAYLKLWLKKLLKNL